MPIDVASFLSSNASAVFGLVGAVAGAALSFLAAFVLGKRDYKLRAWEKILERRMAAHESIMSIATELRVVVGVGGVDTNDEVRRLPQMMRSKEELEAWTSRFATSALEASTWLNLATRRELYLVQDYLVTLNVYLTNVPSSAYPQVGERIRADFIALSASLEKAAYTFFERDFHRLRLGSLRARHKYKPHQTRRRLESTVLLSLEQEIRSLAAPQTSADLSGS